MLASLVKQSLSGVSLPAFSASVVQQVTRALSAEQVEIRRHGDDRPAVPAPLATSRARCVGHEINIPIGPESRPYGVFAVALPPERRLLPSEIEFVTTVADLIGGLAQREQLEAQLRQAQKMEIFGRLTGGIAHDFNNVLAVIGTGISSLETRLGDDVELREDAELIAQGVERGRVLARRLLRFSRTPSEAPGAVDLNLVVGEAQSMMDRILVGQAVLSTELTPAPLMIRADRGEVEQVLMNLVLNARDATPSGGEIRLCTSAAQPRSAAPEVRYVAIVVSDTGIGMDEATRQRMFEPFFTTKAAGQGTGLGLSTVKEIVRRAQGCIEVESAPGRGTRITLYWPSVAAVAANGNSQSAA